MSAKPVGEWAETLMRLGRPQPPYEAFPEQHADDVILSHSGVLVTVGDIRDLQRYLLSQGAERQDRVAAIMRATPDGTEH